MDELEQKLLALDQRRAKRKVASVSEYCRRNDAFDLLIDMIPESSARRRGSIAWVLQHAFDKRRWKPLIGHAETLSLRLSEEYEDTMTKRCLMSYFQKAPLPIEHLGSLADTAIRLIREPKESVAVRAFSITVLMRMVPEYPELYVEVSDSIDRMAQSERASERSRAQKAIKQMNQISSAL